MKWIELLDYLKKLEAAKDPRLEETVVVYSTNEGEYYPGEVMEFNEADDEFIANNQLFIMTFDWGEIDAENKN